ncbi:MAG: SDR family oxidoreductase [Rhodoferax sp.]|nr:SDR family oxidoreductase [Rhodoferax sp.]
MAANAIPNPLDFSGKTVLVVGGSSGIGNGIAQAFRQHGARVHVWGTRAAAADYKAEEGSDLQGLAYARVDVGDFEAVTAASAPDTLDVLVLCQGSVAYGRKEFQIDTFRKIVDINLNSLMACAEKFREALSHSKGSLITISSVGGWRATIGNPAYAASKAGAIHLTATLGKAWAPKGIRVNGVAPGLVDTKLTKVTMDNPQRRQERVDGIPAGRLGTPYDMAGACLYLASPLAAYVFGQTIAVDGGRML